MTISPIRHCVAAGLLLGGLVQLPAQTKFTFEDGVLPPDTAVFGEARLAADATGTNFCLHLTDPADASGHFLVPNIGNGKNVRQVDMRWRSLIGEGFSGGADGYSLNWATDLPETPDYALPGEEGIGSGLTVTVDTWDNGGAEAPGIELRWKSNLVAFASIPKDDPGGGLPFLRRNQFVDAQLTVDSKGLATFTYDGISITATLAGWKGITGGDVLLGARTGGASDRHWIDDLQITTGIFMTGAFSGLFAPADGVVHDRSGFVSLNLNPKGAFSGYLILAGVRYPMSGAFDLETLKAEVSVQRSGTTTLDVELALNDKDTITGTVGDGTWIAQLEAGRQVWHKQLRPATNHVGQYTVVVDRSGGAQPRGYGFGSAAIDAAGAIKFAGSLGDGTKVAQKVAITRDGVWPFYASLYGGQGSILGWIQLNSEEGGRARVTWTKKPGLPGALYPAGFAFRPNMYVAPYTPPTGDAKMLEMVTGSATFDGGNLSSNLVSRIALAPKNQIINLNGTGLTLRFTAKTGLFSGTVKKPDSNAKIKFAGAVFQPENVAAGNFLGTTESGSVIISEDEE